MLSVWLGVSTEEKRQEEVGDLVLKNFPMTTKDKFINRGSLIHGAPCCSLDLTKIARKEQ